MDVEIGWGGEDKEEEDKEEKEEEEEMEWRACHFVRRVVD